MKPFLFAFFGATARGVFIEGRRVNRAGAPLGTFILAELGLATMLWSDEVTLGDRR
jgi:hypothetical protein